MEKKDTLVSDKKYNLNAMLYENFEMILGDFLCNINYKLTDENGLLLTMKGLTNKATPVNLANHVYFNLGKEPFGN